MDPAQPIPTKLQLKDAFERIKSIVKAIESPAVTEDGNVEVQNRDMRWWHHLVKCWTESIVEYPDFEQYTEMFKWRFYIDMEGGKGLEMTLEECKYLQARVLFPRNVTWSMVSVDDNAPEPHLRLMDKSEEVEAGLTPDSFTYSEEELEFDFGHEMVGSTLNNLEKWVVSHTPPVSVFNSPPSRNIKLINAD
jgi:hypothetical protein